MKTVIFYITFISIVCFICSIDLISFVSMIIWFIINVILGYYVWSFIKKMNDEQISKMTGYYYLFGTVTE